jgi:hypothetical protein
LEGRQELARHRRSYDRRQLLLDPAHQQALLQEKRKAIGSTPGGRLVQAVPESRALLDAAFTRGESAGSQTAQLLKLLDTYGPGELRDAIREALEHGRPRASSVALLLRKHQRSRERLARVPVLSGAFDFALQSTLRESVIGSCLGLDFVTEGRSLVREQKYSFPPASERVRPALFCAGKSIRLTSASPAQTSFCIRRGALAGWLCYHLPKEGTSI